MYMLPALAEVETECVFTNNTSEVPDNEELSKLKRSEVQGNVQCSREEIALAPVNTGDVIFLQLYPGEVTFLQSYSETTHPTTDWLFDGRVCSSLPTQNATSQCTQKQIILPLDSTSNIVDIDIDNLLIVFQLIRYYFPQN